MGNGELIINGISKDFIVSNDRMSVLSDISLNIKEGEFLSIVGHSGCGKSTLLKIVAGLVQSDSGDVSLGGNLVNEPNADRGMVFQDHRLFPWMTISDNVALGLKNMPKREKEKIVAEHLELVRLKGFEHAYPHQISGGMSQRAAIARALVNRPKVLLLDEPFGALDALTRIQLQKEVLEIWQKEKTTMILVTHDIDEAIYLSDRIAVMSSKPGRIEEVIDVDIPRPRDRGNSEFAVLKKKVYSHFFKDVEIPIEYNI